MVDFRTNEGYRLSEEDVSHRRCKKAKKELSHAITITYTSSQMTLHCNQGVFGLGERQSSRLVIDDVFLVSLV
jgi:hypothetical protein